MKGFSSLFEDVVWEKKNKNDVLFRAQIQAGCHTGDKCA